MDWGIYRNLLSIKSQQKWICRGAIEDLLMTKVPWWIENLLRIYWPNIELRNLAQWIEEAVENLLRRNPEISMDWESVKICLEKKKEGLDRKESIQNLSISCWAWKKKVFQRREKHIKMNAVSKQLNQRSNQYVKLSKHLSSNMQSIHRSKTHTHTHTTSLTNFIFQIQVKIV